MQAHRDGYAFVTPDAPVPGVKGDIYLSKAEAGRAMNGDRVGPHPPP
jgi:exoribonuclease R